MRHEILSTLLIASCIGCGGVSSVQPLSDDSNSVVDERLLGQWDGGRRERPMVITIGKKRGTNATLVIESVENGRVESLTAFARVDPMELLSIELEDAEDKGVTYVVGRYRFHDADTLAIHPLARQTFGRAVERGELTGEISYTGDEDAAPNVGRGGADSTRVAPSGKTIHSVDITAPAERTLEFIQRNGGASFESKPLLVFRRFQHRQSLTSPEAANGSLTIVVVVALVLVSTLAVAAILFSGNRQQQMCN